MKLYFVRHGKTQWNLEGRLQGSKGDSPLLKESIEQVSELGHYVISFSKLYISTFHYNTFVQTRLSQFGQEENQCLKHWFLLTSRRL